jgi:hypothetical protein
MIKSNLLKKELNKKEKNERLKLLQKMTYFLNP